MARTRSSSQGLREIHLQNFLKRLSLQSLSQPRPNYFVSSLDESSASFLEAFKSEARLLSYKLGTEIYPLAIFFLSGSEQLKFNHCRLVLDQYSQGTELSKILQEALEKFFQLSPDELLKALHPEWLKVSLTGTLDKRPEWSIPTDCEPEWFSEFGNKIPEVVIFPSVLHYKNPYLSETLSCALREVHLKDKILILGTGCGFEAAILAKKTGQRIDAVDINPIAVANTEAVAYSLGVEKLVRAWVSDLYDSVSDKYDLIIFNAPLALEKSSVSHDISRCDLNGKILRRALQGLTLHLKSGGRMLLMSHEDLTSFIPSHLQYKNLKRFEILHKLAVSKISVAPEFQNSEQ